MITLQNITVSYRKSSPVLRDVSMVLQDGMIHGILGRNGIGKSTLIKAICGLLIPDKGNIDLNGFDPGLRLPSMLERLFLVPEELDLPGVSIDTLAATTSKLYPSFSREMFDYNCEELNVPVRRKLSSSSMGERKKAYIAFALACDTPYLLLDEPTNGLDIPSKTVFRRLLASYADMGHTILISTHQVADLENLINNVVILDERGVAINASTDEIATRLKFGVLEPGEDPLFSMQSIVGLVGVSENTSGSETPVSLELLFNAVTTNRKKVTAIMNSKTDTR